MLTPGMARVRPLVRRARLDTLIPCAVIGVALALSGCGGDKDESSASSGKGADTATSAFTMTTPPVARTDSRLPPPSRPAQVDQTQAEIDRQEQINRANKREEAEYTSTPYERAVERLPLHKGPLFVEQVTLDPTHRLIASVEAKRSFCGQSAGLRTAAVKDFYGKADALMRKHGVKDFELYVSPLGKPTTQRYDLATGRDGKVELTGYGRGDAFC